MSSCYLATMVDNLADKVNECLLIGVVASLSEPHTSKLNGGFFIYIYIYMPYVHRSVNASLHSHTDPRRKRQRIKTILYGTRV